MIDLSHEYALLEDGTIEPLWYHSEDGTKEQRNAYQERGKFFLDHDRQFSYLGITGISRHHHKIIRTSDSKEELEKENKE